MCGEDKYVDDSVTYEFESGEVYRELGEYYDEGSSDYPQHSYPHHSEAMNMELEATHLSILSHYQPISEPTLPSQPPLSDNFSYKYGPIEDHPCHMDFNTLSDKEWAHINEIHSDLSGIVIPNNYNCLDTLVQIPEP